MIVFFVGTPGSGKSYEAVKKICDNIRMGRTVCTNIDGMELPKHQEYMKALLDMDDFTFSKRFIFLSKEDVRQFWKKRTVSKTQYLPGGGEETSKTEEFICPPGSLIVIDEVHKHFNARSWQSASNCEMADWASTHRHDGYDLVLITQDIEKVEKQVRSLTEWSYYFRKVNFLGGAVQKKYLCYSYSGDEHRGTPLSKNVRTYDKRYFPCYKSYTTADAKEVGFMSHVNVLKHPIFYAIPVVLIFCFWMLSKSSLASGDLFGTDKKLKSVQQQVDAARSATAAPPPPALPVPSAVIQNPMSSFSAAPETPSVIPSSPAWRPFPVQAYIQDGKKIYFMVHGVTFTQDQCRNYDPIIKTVECFAPDLRPVASPINISQSPSVAAAPSSNNGSDWQGAGRIIENKSVHLSDEKMPVVIKD